MLPKVLLAGLVLILLCSCQSPRKEADWVELFNGRNLDGWTVGGGERKFADADSLKPEAVFVVENGVIHVYPDAKDGSKQSRAVITHDAVLSHYRLQVEYRWLNKRFVPREAANRDAGILVHAHKYFGVWPPSIEMQMGDGHPGEKYVTGDLWVLGDTRVKSPSTNRFYAPDGEWVNRGATGVKGQGRSNVTSIYAEHPHGEWNVAELVVEGSERVLFYLNGILVNEVYDMEKRNDDGSWTPLNEGRITLQAEWAELEYRAVRIKQL